MAISSATLMETYSSTHPLQGAAPGPSHTTVVNQWFLTPFMECISHSIPLEIAIHDHDWPFCDYKAYNNHMALIVPFVYQLHPVTTLRHDHLIGITIEKHCAFPRHCAGDGWASILTTYVVSQPQGMVGRMMIGEFYYGLCSKRRLNSFSTPAPKSKRLEEFWVGQSRNCQ